MEKSGSARESQDNQPQTLTPASDEIINILAQAPDILEFKPSEQATERVWNLISREKEGTLTDDERNELDHYAQVEHIMRLVKARARKRLKQAS